MTDPEPRAGRIFVLVSDLMLSLQLETPAAKIDCTVETVASLAALTMALKGGRPDLIVLDLADPAFPFSETHRLLGEQAPGAAVLAFYPHVRDELGSMARSAGCDLVMPRSRFLTNPSGALKAGLSVKAGESGGKR